MDLDLLSLRVRRGRPRGDLVKSRHVDIVGAFLFGALLVFALFMGGCAVEAEGTDPAPSQASLGRAIEAPEALSVVLAAYGAPGVAPPFVMWVEGAEECYGIGWIEPSVGCVRGAFYTALPNLITVATWPGAKLSQTSLAHEARHWLLWKRGLDTHDHGGDFYAEVARANEALWRGGN